MELIDKIVLWFADGGTDYWTGYDLLVRNSNKKNLLAVLGRKENKSNLDKLRYQLSKLANLPQEVYLDPQNVKLHVDLNELRAKSGERRAESNEFKAESGNEKVKSDSKIAWERKIEGYPELVRAIIHQKGNYHNERHILHQKLSALPNNNEPANVDERAKILTRYEPLCKKIEDQYLAVKAFEEQGIMPDEKLLDAIVVKSNGDTQAQVDLDKINDVELDKKINNMSSNFTKFSNMLKYGSYKKIDNGSPVPDGPKRQKFENKLNKTKEALKTALNEKMSRIVASKDSFSDVADYEKAIGGIVKRLENLK